jgi:hypothetical protein
VETRGLGFIQERAAGLRHHDERAAEEQRVGQPHDDVVVLFVRIARDRRLGQLREPERQVDVGARIVDAPSVAVSGRGGPKPDPAEQKRSVVVLGRHHLRA